MTRFIALCIPICLFIFEAYRFVSVKLKLSSKEELRLIVILIKRRDKCRDRFEQEFKFL